MRAEREAEEKLGARRGEGAAPTPGHDLFTARIPAGVYAPDWTMVFCCSTAGFEADA